MMQQTLDGMRYAVGHPGIRPMLVLLLAMALGVKAFLDLLPGFADAVFDRGAAGLAEMTAAAGLGAFIGAIYLALRAAQGGIVRLTITSLVIGGFGVLALCATDIYWIALVGVFFAGVAVTLGGTGTQTLMQSVVDGAMRGRVMSFYGVIYRGGPAFGALIMGSASDMIGLQPAVAGGGVAALVVFVWMMRRRRAIAATLEGAAERPEEVADPTIAAPDAATGKDG
jgi:predicted MFS family arabinose efflux permease